MNRMNGLMTTRYSESPLNTNDDGYTMLYLISYADPEGFLAWLQSPETSFQNFDLV